MTMRVLIVDDEPLARKVLREELEDLAPDLVVAGEAADGHSALTQIHALRPEIVFLDLQMPGLNGFDVVRELDRGSMPVIIIVTAYERHAVSAFEAGAIDYLLKPVSSTRLAESLQRACRLLEKPAAAAEHVPRLRATAAATPSTSARKIVGRIGEEYFLLRPEEVLAAEADNDVVWLITARQRFLATMSLRALEEKLRGLPFQRIRRNALVNLTHIRKMASLSSQRWLLTLNNQQEFIVSKRQVRMVREVLNG